MERKRVLCVLMVVMLIIAGLAPTVLAEEPKAAMFTNPVPPRPDLMDTLQEAAASVQGSALSAEMNQQEALDAYDGYLQQKLAPAGFALGGAQLGAALDSDVMVVLVEFPDLAHNLIGAPNTGNTTDYHVPDFSSASHYTPLLFSEANEWSLRNYFREASYYETPGTGYDLEGEVSAWYTVSQNANLYGNDDTGGGVDNDVTTDIYSVEDLVMEAALMAWNDGAFPTAAWSDFCDDGSNVDYFIVVHAGKGQEAGGGALGDDALWSGNGSLSAGLYGSSYNVADSGYLIDNYVVLPEDAALGLFVHVMGHLFGLSDTWNPWSGDVTPVEPIELDEIPWRQWTTSAFGEASPAFYDPMAQGLWLGSPLGTRPASMTAFERIQLGWLSPAQGLYEFTLDDLPSQRHLDRLEGYTHPDNKAIKVSLPDKVNVAPYTGDYMRQAPDRSDMSAGQSELTHVFEITATTSAELRFWHRYDLEPGVDKGWIRVRLEPGGSWNYEPIVTGDSTQVAGNVDGWVEKVVDLSAYADGTQSVFASFQLSRDDTIEGRGWFLDDFELWGDGQLVWSDNLNVSDGPDGPAQGVGAHIWDNVQRFPWDEAFTTGHYYLAEWRSDLTYGVGLQKAYNMTNAATNTAEYIRYNPGLLIWYIDELYPMGDNNVPYLGEGFALAVDAHPDPLYEDSGAPFRTRIQMRDGTFREKEPTYIEPILTGSDGVELYDVGGLPAANIFSDKHSSWPYWDELAPDNSVKTPQYGVQLEVIEEDEDVSGAWIRFSLDAAVMDTSTKEVSQAVASPGETLTYTVILTNTGIADAHTIIISDTMPEYLSLDGPPAIESDTPWTMIYEDVDGFRYQGTVLLSKPVTVVFTATLDSIINDGTVVRNIAQIYEGDDLEAEPYADTLIASAPCLLPSEKTVDPSTQLPGGLVTYTLALENSGDSDALNATVTDCVPECLILYSGPEASSGTVITDGNDCIIWNGIVPADTGPTVWITFTGMIRPGEPGICTEIENEALIDDGGYHAPFYRRAYVLVEDGPNIQWSTKEVSLTEAQPGDQLDYVVSIWNAGNQVADVYAIDYFPANTDYISGTLTYSSGAGAVDDVNTPTYWEWAGSVGINMTETIEFSVIITSPLESTTITNTVELSEYNGGSDYTRDAVTEVISEPDLCTSSTKTWESNSLGSGGILTYTVRLVNDGPAEAPMASLVDYIPEGTAYRSSSLTVSSGTGTEPATSSDPVRWNGAVPAYDTVTVTFEVDITLTGTGVITNVATIDDNWTGHDPCDLTTTTTVAALVLDWDPETVIACGDVVRIPVVVSNVLDLQGFEVTVSWMTDTLRLESIDPGTAFFYDASWLTENYSNTLGESTVAAALIATNEGRSGSGVLYWLNFRSIGPGTDVPVVFTFSQLENYPNPEVSLIPHNQVNTTVTVLDRFMEGIAYLQGRSDHTGVEFYANGELLPDTTIADGSYSFCPPAGYGESFIFKAAKTGYLYSEKLVTVDVTGTIEITTVMLLGGDVIGPSITVTTEAPCDPIVTTQIPGEQDGEVNVLDLVFIGGKFDKSSTDPDWGPNPCVPTELAYRADINEDSIVNISDLVLVGSNFNGVAPAPWIYVP